MNRLLVHLKTKLFVFFIYFGLTPPIFFNFSSASGILIPYFCAFEREYVISTSAVFAGIVERKPSKIVSKPLMATTEERLNFFTNLNIKKEKPKGQLTTRPT